MTKERNVARKRKKRRGRGQERNQAVGKQIKQSSDKGWQRRDSGGKTFVM